MILICYLSDIWVATHHIVNLLLGTWKLYCSCLSGLKHAECHYLQAVVIHFLIPPRNNHIQ